MNAFAHTDEWKVVRSFIFNKISVSCTSKSIRVRCVVDVMNREMITFIDANIPLNAPNYMCASNTHPNASFSSSTLAMPHIAQVEFCKMHKTDINSSLMLASTMRIRVWNIERNKLLEKRKLGIHIWNMPAVGIISVIITYTVIPFNISAYKWLLSMAANFTS